MSRTTGQTEVLQAIHDGALSPYTTARTQMQSTIAHIVVHIELVEVFNLEQDVEVRRGYDPDTGCLITCLRDDYGIFINCR